MLSILRNVSQSTNVQQSLMLTNGDHEQVVERYNVIMFVNVKCECLHSDEGSDSPKAVRERKVNFFVSQSKVSVERKGGGDCK